MFSCLLQLPFLLRINLTAKATNSIAKPTNSIANGMNSIAKPTNSIANGTNSIAKATNSISNGMNSIAKSPNSIAKTCKVAAYIEICCTCMIFTFCQRHCSTGSNSVMIVCWVCGRR